MKRSINFSISISTAVFSKAAALLLQILAMPVAVSHLGVNGFVLYGMLISINSWLLLATSGLSPALSVKVSGSEDPSEIKCLASSAYLLFFFIGLSILILGSTFSHFVPVDFYFPDFGHEVSQDIRLSLSILIFGFILQCLCIATDSIMAGLERQYYTNLAVLTGCTFSLVSILILKYEIAAPSDLLLIVILPPIILRFLFGVIYCLCAKLLSIKSVKSKAMWSLLSRAVDFFKAGSLTNFLLHVAPVIYVGRFYPESIAAVYVALNTLVVLAASLISTITLPIVPSIRRSLAEGDHEWSRRSLVWLKKYTFFLILATVIFAISFASPILSLIFDKKINFTQEYIIFTAIYFCTLVWSNYCYSLASIFDSIEKITPHFLCKSIFSVIALVILTAKDVYIFPFAVFATGFFLFEYFQVRQSLSNDKNEKN